MAYRVEIHRNAQKQILALQKEAQIKLSEAIDGLAENPRPAGCKKLRETSFWRIKVGAYRVIYSIDDDSKLITIVKAARRKENTYKNL